MKNQEKIIIEKNYPEANIKLLAVNMGRDISIQLFGGDLPHIGAISVWDQSQEKVQSITLPSHKETVVTELIASTVGKAKHCNVSVSAGIHYDTFSKKKLDEVLDIAKQVSAYIIA